MSYLAQGLNRGFEQGVGLVEARRRRKQEEELARAERELRVTQQAREHENRRTLQDAEQTFRGTQTAEERAARQLEAERERGWRSGEGERERGFRRGERIDAQGFQSSESALERAARVIAQDKELKDRVDAREIELPMTGMRLGLMARAQDWQESERNPLNRYRDAAAQGKLGEIDEISINGGPQSPLTSAMRPAQANGGRPQFENQLFGKEVEGKTLIGPDGKTYVIRNGRPVPAK